MDIEYTVPYPYLTFYGVLDDEKKVESKNVIRLEFFTSWTGVLQVLPCTRISDVQWLHLENS